MNSNDEFLKNMLASAEAQNRMSSSASEYLKTITKIGEIQKAIDHGEKSRKTLLNEQKQLLKEQRDLLDKQILNGGRLDKADKKRLKTLNGLVPAQQALLDSHQSSLESLRRQNDEYIQQVKNVKKLNLTVATTVKALGKIPDLLKDGYSRLESTGIFKVDKEIRLAARSLNVSSKNAKAFGQHLNTASKATGSMGIHTEDLANMQENYSEEIGRSVMLSEAGLIAMGRMASGTNLGAKGAGAMAASMDDFNLSVVASADYVEETVKIAAKMGINSSKSLKNLQTNLKLAQRFNFKGGVKSLTTMANEAARLKIDMESISGLAEKVFRPEGAVEMAAQLQVMGGEFAKLGDPMQLMFKARNDFAGFAKDIAGATSEFVEFNKQTGETVIKGGLAADRMREISKITGINIEELTKMAGAQKKMFEYGSLIPPSITSKEDRELIASIAKMNDKGEAVITIDNKDFKLKDLDKSFLKNIKNEQESLEERGKQVQSFDENLNNFIKTLKSTLLPFVQGLNEGFGKDLSNFTQEMKENGWFDKIKSFMSGAGEVVKTITDTLGVKGTFAALIGLKLLSKASWISNGLLLARGFNRGARLTGNTPLGGFPNGASSPINSGPKSGGRMMGKLGKAGKYAKFGKLAKIGAIGGVASMGLDGLSNAYDDDLTTGEAFGKTLDQNKYMLGGAAIGAAFGGVGAIPGAAIGGVLDFAASQGLLGGEEGLAFDYGGNKKQKSVSINDGIINFNPSDKFMRVGESAMVAGTSVNGNRKLAEEISNSGSKDGKVKHSFDDLNININLNSDSSWLNKIGSEITNDRQFVRDLTVKIQEEIRMAVGGGKLNPNPLS